MTQTSKHTTIGIIGTGRFGNTLKKLFEKDRKCFKIHMSSTSKPIDNKVIFPIKTVINSDVVFPAIPIRHLESFLKNNSNLIHSDTQSLFIGVCSLCVSPSIWLKKHLPKHVDLVSSHPLFGPVSTKNGTDFANLNFVFWPVRVKNKDRLQTILKHLTAQGINITKMKPEVHDNLAARSQAISFLFGQIGLHLKLSSNPNIDTPGFNHILENQNRISKDSPELFQDMYRFNPKTQKILTQIQIFLKEIQNSIK